MLPRELSISGRLSRAGFWLRHAGALPTGLFVAVAADDLIGRPWDLVAVALLLLSLVSVWGRRLHDRNLSAAWLLAGLVPVLGAGWLLIECGLRGTHPKAGRYGPMPRLLRRPERTAVSANTAADDRIEPTLAPQPPAPAPAAPGPRAPRSPARHRATDAAMRAMLPASLLLAALWTTVGSWALAPEDLQRPQVRSLRSVPGWFLAASHAEYAAFLERDDPAPLTSRFPLFAHIGLFWDTREAVVDQTASEPWAPGEQSQLLVAGLSTSFDYAIRGLYERSLGRLSEALSDGTLTDEDRLAARVARQRAEQMRLKPWQPFAWDVPLRALWSEVPVLGPNALRKLERRWWLSSQYAFHVVAERLSAMSGTAPVGAVPTITAVVVDRLPEAVVATLPPGTGVERLADGVRLLVPRAAGFTETALALSRQAIQIREIAGNRGEIVVSLLADSETMKAVPGTHVLLTQPVMTRPGRVRVVAAVPVPALSDALRLAIASRTAVEQVHDF